MLIYIDTNIFFGQWLLDSANFSYFFNFIENEGHTLLLSEVVIDETDQLRKREWESAKSSLMKNIKSLDILCGEKLELSTKKEWDHYSLKSLIVDKLEPSNIHFVSYDNVPQKELVNRAILQKRPFREKEKGYRDSVIWLSLLNHLSINNVTEDVAFISANVNDFLNIEKKEFHNDLLDDISEKEIKYKIVPFVSLSSFIDTTFSVERHMVADNEIDKVMDDIEERTIDVINAWTTEELKQHLTHQYPNIASLLTIEDHLFEIDEGLEDSEILNVQHIVDRTVFIDCEYDFRICSITITLSKKEFDLLESELPVNNLTEVNSELVSFEFYDRLYFEVGLQYNSREREIEKLSINRLSFKNGYRA
ncbi:PIN domain-containing protein [Sphingobacterium oryzagri]|uniref:PIN domain-containing protein n=1 Tax=Sphingobacterium oryzagri TaxID=3025669 RepID=A0ABY7WM52_9SPHI|nr:PIN domain-containing protein [Sphingobacterium sp. KACC 22765]WDF69717.1 PIN domain-containing protein [Sphingobacterium sp. KACC 22765]